MRSRLHRVSLGARWALIVDSSGIPGCSTGCPFGHPLHRGRGRRGVADRWPAATPSKVRILDPPPSTIGPLTSHYRSGGRSCAVRPCPGGVRPSTVTVPNTCRNSGLRSCSWVKGADYLMTIKGNQPTLLAAAQQALSGPAAEFAEYTEHDRGHGRTEERILRTAPITADAPIDFPHAAQVFRVIRYVGGLDGQRRTKEVAHCITSLTPDNAAGQDLAQLLRDHWGAIEIRLHWVRDTTFNEDKSTLRAGTAPQAMAIIRNTIMAAFRFAGWTNLKKARRHFSHGISWCVDLITKPVKTDKDQT